MLARVRSAFLALVSRRRFEAGMKEELRFHVERYAEDLVRSGVPVEEARRRAGAEFGGFNAVQEECRDARGLRLFDELGRELRDAARQLRRNPGFTLTVVVTLALAIGANTAIFSVVNALLLTDLPYARPDRLGTTYARITGARTGDSRRTVDGEQWELLRDHVPSVIPSLSAIASFGVNVQSGTQAFYLRAGKVSARYLDVLGIHPAAGRNFSEDEDRPNGPRSVILSHDLWRRMFAANPDVLGQTLLVRGEPHTIVGILRERDVTPLDADIYTPLRPSREGEGRGANYLCVVRLRDGATWQQADTEINRAWAGTRRVQAFAASNPDVQMTYHLVPLQRGATDTLRPQVLAVMTAAALILLIACANLAGLALVRLSRRTGELATRLALGASGWQIQRQLWAENLLLALAGGLTGTGVGFVVLRVLLRLLPERYLPVTNVPLDARVLGFTLSVSLLTCVCFGMLPALVSRRGDLRAAIPNRTVIAGGGVRLRQGLIAGQVALTVVLLAASGLLIRTLVYLQTLPPGFDPSGVITAKASLDDVRYHDPAAFRNLLARSLSAMRAIPGVENAAVGATAPYERPLIDGFTMSDGKDAGREISTNALYVTPGYFEALRIAVKDGRTFTDADGAGAQPVVIVNQAFVRKFFGGTSPIGRYLNKKDLIIGVVGDTMHSSAAQLNRGSAPLTAEETLYVPAAQLDARYLALVHTWFQPSWIVRARGPIEGLTRQMQQALASADPLLPFSGFYSMNDLMSSTLATQRIEVWLLTSMSALALLLSAVGIFALVANIVSQRTREIGIRMALGSTIRAAMIDVGRAGLSAAAAGVIAGLALCAATLRVLRSALYGVGAYDAPTLLFVVLTLSLVALCATTLPVLRIAHIDPATTLRE